MNSTKAPHVVKCGWVDKLIQGGLPLLVIHSPRFLVLTSKWLRYYHKAVELNTLLEETPEAVAHEYTEIPVGLINETVMLSSASQAPDTIHVENTGTKKLYKFKTSCAEEALEWRVAITTMRSRLLPAVLEQKVQTKEESLSSTGLLFELKKNDDLVASVERAYFSSEDRAKVIAEQYFSAINTLTVRERNSRAKEIGRGLVSWLESNPGAGSSHISKKASGQLSAPVIDKAAVVAIWFRTALSREFFSSCKFEEPPQPTTSSSNLTGGDVARISEDGESSSVSSSITQSTVRSRIRQAHRGSIIMPFRADTAECLFLSSIIHASCMKDSTLKSILHSVLRPIASAPEQFTFPKPVLGTHPLMSKDSFSEDDGDKLADGKSNNKSFMSKFWGLFGCSSPSIEKGNAPTAHPQPQPHRAEYAVATESQHAIERARHSNSAGVEEQSVHRSLSLSEIGVLSPIEVQRMEVRHRLIDIVSELVEKLQNTSASNDVPALLVTLVHAIRDIIINVQTDNKEASDEDSEMARLRRRFEYGTFFTSCCALLFLRLICRAIVTPDEYGVTEKLQSSAEQGVNFSLWPHRALPFVGSIANALQLECLEQLKPRDNTGSKRHYKLSAEEIDELVSLSKELKSSVSNESVSQCLDTFELHQYCLSYADELQRDQIDRNRLNCGDDSTSYKFDFSKPSTRWALAEVAKSVQHIANISCLPKDEMQAFARESLVRQNIAAGVQDKDTYDTHELTGPETETILAQVQIASKVKEVYEKLGDLPTGNW